MPQNPINACDAAEYVLKKNADLYRRLASFKLEDSMPNGKPGDHPLTDILVHEIETYGFETDDLIRKVSKLCSRAEFDIWWELEISWSQVNASRLEKAKTKFAEVSKRAKESGWEIE
jgi:hypothetical protein